MTRVPRVRRFGWKIILLLSFFSFFNIIWRFGLYRSGSHFAGQKRTLEIRSWLSSQYRKANFTPSSREVNFMKNLFSETSSNTKLHSNPFSYGILAVTYLSSGFDYYGRGSSYSFVFSSMLFSSWKYILNFYPWSTNPNTAIKLDLLVFYDNRIDSRRLPPECVELKSPAELSFREPSRCYKRAVEPTEYNYSYINQFAFLQDPQIEQIVTRYNYTLRTDPDCFFAPEIFNWRVPKSTGIVFNEWSYATDFNHFMLRVLSEELGWKRQNITSVGSTWLVRSDFFLPLMAKTIFATMYVYEHGWNVTRYPIVSHWIRRGASKEGMWPDWWRPVSLLYGGDLAVHDYFDHLDELINQPYNALDADAHELGRIYDVMHIHAIGGDGKFNKFDFFQQMEGFCKNGKPTPELMNQFLNSSISNMEPMSGDTYIQDYAYAIAIKGAVDYILQNGCFVNLDKPW